MTAQLCICGECLVAEAEYRTDREASVCRECANADAFSHGLCESCMDSLNEDPNQDSDDDDSESEDS